MQVMITKSFKSLGLSVAILVPGFDGTISEDHRAALISDLSNAPLDEISAVLAMREYDALAKKAGSAVESAINNEVYRGVLADFRSEFTDTLETQLVAQFPDNEDVKRRTKQNGTKKVTAPDGTVTEEPKYVYAESEQEYVNRMLALLAKTREVTDVPITEFQSLVDAILAKDDVDEETGSIDGKLIRFDPTRPERKPAGPKKTPDYALKAADQIIAAGQGTAFATKFGVSGEPTRESIGAKIHELELAEARARQAQLANKYAA